MEKVISRDGVSIAYERSGAGPALALVHGAVSDHTRWAPILPELEKRFTVFAMDRRGRGESGDSPDYSLEREIDDVVAVVESIGEPVSLLGHSLGGFFALEAALAAPHLRKLVLDEPDVEGASGFWEQGLADAHALFDVGDKENALVMFLLEVAKLTPGEVEFMRRLPSWPARVAAAHTVIREVEGLLAYRSDLSRFPRLDVPTLLLLGGSSAPECKMFVELLAAALPTNRVAVIPGQGHIAMLTAPDLWLAEVIGFLAD